MTTTSPPPSRQTSASRSRTRLPPIQTSGRLPGRVASHKNVHDHEALLKLVHQFPASFCHAADSRTPAHSSLSGGKAISLGAHGCSWQTCSLAARQAWQAVLDYAELSVERHLCTVMLRASTLIADLRQADHRSRTTADSSTDLTTFCHRVEQLVAACQDPLFELCMQHTAVRAIQRALWLRLAGTRHRLLMALLEVIRWLRRAFCSHLKSSGLRSVSHLGAEIWCKQLAADLSAVEQYNRMCATTAKSVGGGLTEFVGPATCVHLLSRYIQPLNPEHVLEQLSKGRAMQIARSMWQAASSALEDTDHAQLSVNDQLSRVKESLVAARDVAVHAACVFSLRQVLFSRWVNQQPVVTDDNHKEVFSKQQANVLYSEVSSWLNSRGMQRKPTPPPGRGGFQMMGKQRDMLSQVGPQPSATLLNGLAHTFLRTLWASVALYARREMQTRMYAFRTLSSGQLMALSELLLAMTKGTGHCSRCLSLLSCVGYNEKKEW